MAAIPLERCCSSGAQICCIELPASVVVSFQGDYQLLALLEEALAIWPFGRSVALTRRELPGSEAIRALYSTPPTEGRTIRRISVNCVRRALPIRRIGPLT